MFDIGFFELLIIAVVGLFVIGPEQLPSTIKSIAIWVSRIKRNLLDTRRELEEQIGADEIRREIYNEQVLHNLEKMKDTKAELEQRINEWKDEALAADAYLDETPDAPDVDPSHADNANDEVKRPDSANYSDTEPSELIEQHSAETDESQITDLEDAGTSANENPRPSQK